MINKDNSTKVLNLNKKCKDVIDTIEFDEFCIKNDHIIKQNDDEDEDLKRIKELNGLRDEFNLNKQYEESIINQNNCLITEIKNEHADLRAKHSDSCNIL